MTTAIQSTAIQSTAIQSKNCQPPLPSLLNVQRYFFLPLYSIFVNNDVEKITKSMAFILAWLTETAEIKLK